jgi:hypothetical protein
MALCGNSLLRSLSGVKRTWLVAVRMSAFDPKRIAVTVAQIHRDPVVRDCLVESALKIAVAYVEKIIALKYAARRYPVAHENAEDLATNFIIGRSVKHGHLRSRDASVTLSHSALAVRRHPCNLESYPASVSNHTADCAT